MPAEHVTSIEVNAAFFRQNKAAVGPVPFDTAWAMIQAAHAYAQRFGNAITAVVVDEAGAPIAGGRMETAAPNTAELALNKAYTAAAFHVATTQLVPHAHQPWLRSLVIAHRGRVMPVGGALPIINGVTLVGAIGVAGSSRPDQDVLCCRAAMAVWENPGH
jgi:uncharacterized protein GlcG (DUF336 family)